MKGLKVVLWICGIVMLLEFAWMLVPVRILADWSWLFGVELSLDATSTFMMRECQALSGLVGVFLIILAKDPLKYGPMVLLAACGSIFLGLVVLAWGLRYGLPAIWICIGALLCIVVGLLILFFRGQALQENRAPQGE